MFTNRDVARKLKTDISSSEALEHTFGRNIRSCNVELQEGMMGEQESQTRIKLLGSFQESYISDHSFSRQEPQGPSKSELQVLRKRLDSLREEVAAERLAAQTAHHLVQIQRAVNEHLRQRLQQSTTRDRSTSSGIHRNRTNEHLTHLLTSYLQAGDNYCRTMQQLAESHGLDP